MPSEIGRRAGLGVMPAFSAQAARNGRAEKLLAAEGSCLPLACGYLSRSPMGIRAGQGAALDARPFHPRNIPLKPVRQQVHARRGRPTRLAMFHHHIRVDAAPHIPLGRDAHEARVGGFDDVVEDGVGDLLVERRPRCGRVAPKYIFRLLSSMQSSSAIMSMVKCAKSGWPVSGQWQVNSGTWNWITAIAPNAGLGEDEQLLAGLGRRVLGHLASWVLSGFAGAADFFGPWFGGRFRRGECYHPPP